MYLYMCLYIYSEPKKDVHLPNFDKEKRGDKKLKTINKK